MEIVSWLKGSRKRPAGRTSVPSVVSPERRIREAFWLVLGREVTAVELPTLLRETQSNDLDALIARLVSSPEFRLVYLGWKQGLGSGRDPAVREQGLQALGPDEWFAARSYTLLLGRPADEGGRRNFIAALTDGASRSQMVRSLVLSEEFERRYGLLAPQGGFVPLDTQLCELANPAKWDNPDWMKLLYELQVIPEHKLSMHRKSYEFTQLLYGLTRLGRLRDDVSVLSVGAGHECVLYWLANHVRRVVATDLYEGQWQSVGSQEGDAGVVRRPEAYAPFPYEKDRLTCLRMNGLHLGFQDDVFDVVYSLSSIEHFGGVEAGAAAIREMARVLKPDGILALATEYALSGLPHGEVFQPHEIRTLTSQPGLRLVQPIDESVYSRYEYVPVDLYTNPHQTPHMVVQMGHTVFTSVMAFFEKV